MVRITIIIKVFRSSLVRIIVGILKIFKFLLYGWDLLVGFLL